MSHVQLEISNTITTWKPHPIQEEFIRIPDSIKEGFFGGAKGPGKSEILTLLPILRGWYRHPDYKGIILRRTFPELESEIIVRSFQYYPSTGAKYNQGRRRWEWSNGAYQAFGHCENEIDIKNYDGVEYNYVGFDELTHFTEYQYLYLVMSRNRRKAGSSLPAITRSASNPGNIGHTWVRKRFVDPAPSGKKIILDALHPKFKKIFIPATVDDNPSIDPDYKDQLELLPEADRKAAKGDWYSFTGQAFAEFRKIKLDTEPSNALHVIEPFQIPDWWPKFSVTDWAGSNITSSYIFSVGEDRRIYISSEYWAKNKKIAEWASDLKERDSKESNVLDVVLDSNAFNDTGHEHTTAQQFEDVYQRRPTPAIKGKGSRISGKTLVHEFLRWISKPTRNQSELYNPDKAEELLRLFGLTEYKNYLSRFKNSEVETNLPKLQIFSDCTKLIDCLGDCVNDPDNPGDIKEYDGDDPYDCLRYGLLASKNYIDSIGIKKEQYIVNQGVKIEDCKDINHFYRKAEIFDVKKNSFNAPVLTRSARFGRRISSKRRVRIM